jgi:hypothetical protein
MAQELAICGVGIDEEHPEPRRKGVLVSRLMQRYDGIQQHHRRLDSSPRARLPFSSTKDSSSVLTPHPESISVLLRLGDLGSSGPRRREPLCSAPSSRNDTLRYEN